MHTFTVLLIIFFLICKFVICLENGLAKTPPMGWLAWTRFMCQINCDKYPKECISENLFMDMANQLVKMGYRDAGYVHINIDDCWTTKQRDENNRLVADPKRFPHGIKWLAQYMHDRGLKLGIYANYGTQTCMGFPGSQDYMEIDAKTFASWNVDMLKFDGCFNDPRTLDSAYPQMGKYLNETGRKMIYSCSWPFYIRTEARRHPNYDSIAKHCNLWRNFDDIQIHWKSIEKIINFYDVNQDELAQYHGPGHWNDPDMIIIGNEGLTPDQCRAQMALWAIWSAPLLMSNDLRTIKAEFREILINQKVLAVNQDRLGIMGKKHSEYGVVNVYVKPILPTNVQGNEYSYAIVFFNKDESQIKNVNVRLQTLGLKYSKGYDVENLFTYEEIGSKLPSDEMEVRVPPTGVVMWKATVNDLPVDKKEEPGGGDKKPIDKRTNISLYFGDTHDSLWNQWWPYFAVVIFALFLWHRRSQLLRCFRRKRFI